MDPWTVTNTLSVRVEAGPFIKFRERNHKTFRLYAFYVRYVMIRKSMRKTVALGGVGLSALIACQSADAEMIVDAHSDLRGDLHIPGDIGTFNGKPDELKGSVPVNFTPPKAGATLEWVQNNGADLKEVNVNGVGRAPTVKFTMYHEGGGISVGSGAFIGNSTILSVAHNFLGSHKGTKISRVTATVGSNSEVSNNWEPTSGYTFDIPLTDIKFIDKAGYLKGIEDDTETAPVDISLVRSPIPFQFIVNKLKAQNVDLGTYKPLELADEAEIERINKLSNDVSGEHIHINGYPAANEADQKYFNPRLKQGRLYEIDTTIHDVINYPMNPTAGVVRSARLRNSTLGGMSGSSMRNANNKVIGIHQAATPRNDKTDKDPNLTENWRAYEMLLNQHHYNWIKELMGDQELKGFTEYEGKRYYFDENGTFFYNTTKTIKDGKKGWRNFKFDETGAATDIGAAEDPTKPVVTTKTEKIKFKTEYIDDPEMMVGEEHIDQEGEDGEELITSSKVGNAEPTVTKKVTKPVKNKIIRRGTKSVTSRKEKIAFQVEYIDDPEMLLGEEHVVQEGEDGEKEITITSTGDGKSNTVEKILKEPKKKIIRRGTNNQTRRTEKIPFKVREVDDEDLAEGVRIVQQKGVEGIREFVTTIKAGKKGSDGSAANVLNFTTKAGTRTATNNETKPLTLVAVIDYSSSYGNKIDGTVAQLRAVIERSLTNDNSKVIFQNYVNNHDSSYSTNSTGSFSSIAMSKAQALQVLDRLGRGQKLFAALDGVDASLRYQGDIREFEAIAEAVAPKDTDISVLQFTDEWVENEDIDESFAAWAKRRAKTFMSVVNPKGRQGQGEPISIRSMKRVGHPNIYDLTGKSDTVAIDEIVRQFSETGTTKVTTVKGEDQTAHIQIGGNGVTVTKATLDGKDLPIVDGKVDVTKKLPDGNHKVEYEATGDGTLNGKVDVDGKESDKKTDTLKRVADIPGSSNTTDKILREPVEEIIRVGVAGEKVEVRKEPIPFLTEIVEDENLPDGEERVTVEGMVGEREFRTTYKTVRGKVVGEPIRVDEFIVKHMRTKIVHRGVKGSVTETEHVKIPYTTKIVKDPTMLKGERKIVQTGKDGNRDITRTWTTWRKRKIGDPQVSEAITTPMVEEIIHVGTREDIMEVNYDFLSYNKVTGDKSVDGMRGSRALFDFYSLAEGKRVGESRSTMHLLRMPVNQVAGNKSEKKPAISVRRTFSLPPEYVSKPRSVVEPYSGTIKPSALSILRRTHQQAALELTTNEAVTRLYSSLKSLSVKRW